MKLTAWPWIAAASALLIAAGFAQGARRPFYGGTLRIEIHAQIRTLDPAEIAFDADEFSAKQMLAPLVFETLAHFDSKGRLDSGKTGDVAREQARLRNAAVTRGQDGSLSGTGPFKIARWEPGRSATLIANDEYRAGRPFVDAIEIQMGRSLRDQAADLNLGKADVIEAPLTGEPAGVLPNRVLALVFASDKIPASVREALSLAIDRSTIQKVLLRDRGEAAGSLLPRWLSGYAFLFPAQRDVAKARQLANAALPISFGYSQQDTGIRRIAERISVNAMEAGITLRPANGSPPDVQLELLPITARDELASLEDLADLLKLPLLSNPAPYEAERSMLDGFRVIPVLHVSVGWSLRPQVHNWPDLPNVWIDPQ